MCVKWKHCYSAEDELIGTFSAGRTEYMHNLLKQLNYAKNLETIISITLIDKRMCADIFI